MIAVFKKELKSCFNSMIGYIFVAFIIFIVSMFFSIYNLYAQSSLLRNAINGVSFILVIVMPILTMRVMAEERRQKTDQLLYTSPAKITDIVLGKYLSLEVIYLFPVLLFCLYPFIMKMYGKSPASMAMDYVALLGFYLIGSLYIAIGLFLSSITENQVIAAVMTFGVLMVTYFIGSLLALVPGSAIASLIGFAIVILVIAFIIYAMTKHVYISAIVGIVSEIALIITFFVNKTMFEGAFAKVFGILDCQSKLNNFLYGILDLTNVVYFLSGCVLFIFLTVQAVQKRRYS